MVRVYLSLFEFIWDELSGLLGLGLFVVCFISVVPFLFSSSYA
jgi:hypothetical protein